MNPAKTPIYIVSGLPPSEGGVGRLIRKLSENARAHNAHIITHRAKQSLEAMLKKKAFIRMFIEIANRQLGRLHFIRQVRKIENAKVVFIHPQTAGFDLLFYLLKHNKVFVYVMDNSFFCIRSYNIHPHTHEECLQCIGAPEKADTACVPFPIAIDKSKNINYLEHLMQCANEIHFLAQNRNQKKLLTQHFGNDIRCDVVGMDTGELIASSIDTHPSTFQTTAQQLQFDVVFHGAPLAAKGFDFTLELAKRLPQYRFMIPSSKYLCERTLGKPISLPNIVFEECSWDTGLKEAIENALVVLNTSLWSAPIEGALLKSIVFGNKVATIKTQYGFENEAASLIDAIEMPFNTDEAAVLLRKAIEAIQAGQAPSDPKAFVQFYKQSNKDVLDFVEAEPFTSNEVQQASMSN